MIESNAAVVVHPCPSPEPLTLAIKPTETSKTEMNHCVRLWGPRTTCCYHVYLSRAQLDLLHRLTFADQQAERNIKEQEDDENEDLLNVGEYSDSEALESTAQDQEEEAAEKPWETLTGAKAKAKVKLFQDRHWVVTEIFYANLAAATERLKATRAQERG